MRLHPAPLLLALLASLSAAGCVAVAAGATAGYLVSKETLEGEVQQATVALDVEKVWREAQATLRTLSTKGVSVQASPRIVRGEVDGADVSIEVQAYDLDRTVILVEAKKTLSPAGTVAERVLNAVLDRLH
jgi:hypothetical protein